MTAPATDLHYERRSLATGMWANLLMGAAGITAAQLSNSDALMVDGLYSGVNFCSAIIAGRVATSLHLSRTNSSASPLHEPPSP
jgi:divalent metal cation (Fe/Co/Zn/Cd) transporter